MDERSPWHGWAMDQLQTCSERYPLHVNIIIYTELLVPNPNVAALDAMLDIYETTKITINRPKVTELKDSEKFALRKLLSLDIELYESVMENLR